MADVAIGVNLSPARPILGIFSGLGGRCNIRGTLCACCCLTLCLGRSGRFGLFWSSLLPLVAGELRCSLLVVTLTCCAAVLFFWLVTGGCWQGLEASKSSAVACLQSCTSQQDDVMWQSASLAFCLNWPVIMNSITDFNIVVICTDASCSSSCQ